MDRVKVTLGPNVASFFSCAKAKHISDLVQKLGTPVPPTNTTCLPFLSTTGKPRAWEVQASGGHVGGDQDLRLNTLIDMMI